MSSVHEIEKIRIELRADWKKLRLRVHRCTVGESWNYDVPPGISCIHLFFLLLQNARRALLSCLITFRWLIQTWYTLWLVNLVGCLKLSKFFRFHFYLSMSYNIIVHQTEQNFIDQLFFVLFSSLLPLFIQQQRKPVLYCILCSSFYILCHLRPLLHAIQLQYAFQ